ncbi:hypothetical protein [Scytonema sp. NUACC26]|uniref:hypothetical protein n=1 Tax=Scytonema sp. NUACC26 TaxID=3140176 RepID=UPI0034DC258C
MPSASSGRYQSRLFNFFHQQSRRLGEQFERTVRQIKVTASWSIEGFLHSVYMLIQKTVESSSRQLNTSEQKRSLHLQGHATDSQQPSSPSADNAIVRVLEVVPTLQIKDKQTQGDRDKHFFLTRNFPIFHYLYPLVRHSPTSQSPIANRQSPIANRQSPIANRQYIQGVASNLANRNLVLVTANNEILDVLTFQQQKKLQNRINEELKICESQSVKLIEPALDEVQILPEIDRLLNKLISGKQDNEPALLTEAIAQDKNTNNLPITYQGLAILDETIANLEAKTLVPISRTSAELLQTVQTQLNIFLYGKQQSITSQEKVLSTKVGENQTSNILSLIWEAIHYFFGEKPNKDLEPDLTSKERNYINKPRLNGLNSLVRVGGLHLYSSEFYSHKNLPKTSLNNSPKNSQVQDTETVAPWLTIDDLFNNSSQVKEVDNEPQLSARSNTNFILPDDLSYHQKLLHYFQSKTSKLKQILGSVNRQKSIVANSHSQITELDNQKTKEEAIQFYRQTYAIEAKPDWIETSATTIGYVKHPLELILEWLDRTILWIERIVVNIFMFFQGLLRGK